MSNEELENLLKPRQPRYKRARIVMPHCPECGEMLQGNNSIISPWTCSCGVWESEWGDISLHYKIKIKSV